MHHRAHHADWLARYVPRHSVRLYFSGGRPWTLDVEVAPALVPGRYRAEPGGARANFTVLQVLATMMRG